MTIYLGPSAVSNIYIGSTLISGAYVGSSTAINTNLLSSLSWQAGASTTLSIASGKARATTTDGASNPRIFKGPFHTISGKTYRYQGTIYPGTIVSNMFLRVSTDGTIQNDGPVQHVGDTSGPLVINSTWTAGSNIDLYLGIVGVVNTIGQYVEIDNNFSITQIN